MEKQAPTSAAKELRLTNASESKAAACEVGKAETPSRFVLGFVRDWMDHSAPSATLARGRGAQGSGPIGRIGDRAGPQAA